MRRALHPETMSRFISPRRSVFSMSRLPLKLEKQAQKGQATNIHKVRFGKPPVRFRTVAMSCATFFTFVWVYDKVVLEPLARAAMENIQEGGEMDGEEEKPLFIPFPGTTTQLPPQPYRGTDPEWQEFIKFSKDQAQAKRVREELANFVLTSADKHPILSLRCGKGMKLRRYWLDVDFPQVAPPEFVRSGIEITDDYIAWAQNPVDSLLVFKLRQVLWPTALFQSIGSFTRVMIVDDMKRVAGILGINTTPPPSLEQILARHQQIMKPPTLSKDGSQVSPVSDPSKAIVKAPTPAPTPEKSSVMGEDSEDGEPNVGTQISMALQAHFLRPIMAFKTKLSQTWKPVRDYPPRGSILVSGFVELDAPKAWLVFDVKAAWDPKTREYDARSMNLQLRRFQLKKQGPAPGT